jgi:hypothetical protein
MRAIPLDSKPPWRKDRKMPPGMQALSNWRGYAQRAAIKAGARWSCGICKRPIGDGVRQIGRHGMVIVRGAVERGMKRRICSLCHVMFKNFMVQMEKELDRFDLPPEVIGQRIKDEEL